MPIKVACACGAAFAAKDELAGRTVKCPKCGQPLSIPAAGAPPAARPAAKAPAQKPAPAPRPASSAGGSSIHLGSEAPKPGASDVFSDVGLGKQAAGTRPCPGCMAPMPQNAIICIKCGYNAKLGRRMETIKSGGSGEAGPGGHDAAGAQDLLNRAAQIIAEDQEAERQKTSEGLPWWGYLLALGGVVGFIVMMMVLPKGVGLMTGGIVMYGIVVVASFYAWIRILIIAFNEGVAHGVGCLLCGIYVLIYSIMRWDRCGTYLLIMIAANVVGNLLGFAFGLLAQQMADPEATGSREPSTRMVCRGEPWQLPLAAIKS